jgi:ferredoxin--NADP+ reductase
VDVVIEGDDLDDDDDTRDDAETTFKLQLARQYAARPRTPGNKWIVFRFHCTLVKRMGTDAVTRIRVEGAAGSDGGNTAVIETSLALSSIGYAGAPVRGVSFDDDRAVIPNDVGRVADRDGAVTSGVYLTGWIKRGPRGVIGTNRTCAGQTVAQLWADFDDGNLAGIDGDRASLDRLLVARKTEPLNWKAWRAIDGAERRRGRESSRPRVTFVEIDEMLATARAPRS